MPLVTDIVPQKRNKKFCSVFIDNKYLFSLSSDDLNFLQIKINDDLTQEKLNDYVNIFSLQKAKDYAYRIITRKSYSEKALIEKLQKRFPENIIAETVKSLKVYNYIDDEKLIKEYAVNKTEMNLLGPMKLKQELYNKKFDPSLIDKTVEEVFKEHDEYELADKLFEQKYKGLKGVRDIKVLNKIKNYFLSRGFHFDVVLKILNKVK